MAKNRTLLLQLAVFLLAPNVFLFLLGRVFFVSREPINVDYLLLGVVLPLAGSVPVGIAAAGLAIVDMLEAASEIFHFTGANVLESLDDLALLGRTAWLPVAALVAGSVLYGFCVGAVLRRARGTRQTALVLFLIAVALTTIDHILVFSDVAGGNQPKRTTSAMADLGLSLLHGGAETNAAPLSAVPDGPRAATEFLRTRSRSLPRHVVLTIVESWGSYSSPVADSLQVARLTDPRIRERYDTRFGLVRFEGSTVAAEFRELCWLRYRTERPDMSQVDGQACLPSLLGALGYHSVGVHGFHRGFFNRSRWYPSLGFDETLFQANLMRREGLQPSCGGPPFSGLCDPAVGAVVAGMLAERADEKLFLYWLTLNGHYPVGARPARQSDFSCAGVPELREHGAICDLARTHDMVFATLAEMALDSRQPPTAFVVVGDHSPAFPTRRLRRVFREAVVPYVILWPRCLEQAGC